MSQKFPAIPEPTEEIATLLASVRALKEAVEILTRQRQPISNGAVTWQDLVDLELIEDVQVPER